MGVADPKLHGQSADGVLGYKVPLSNMIAPKTLAEVNKEVKLGQKKKRGLYLFCKRMEIKKAQVVHGSTAVSMELEQLCNNLASR